MLFGIRRVPQKLSPGLTSALTKICDKYNYVSMDLKDIPGDIAAHCNMRCKPVTQPTVDKWHRFLKRELGTDYRVNNIERTLSKVIPYSSRWVVTDIDSVEEEEMLFKCGATLIVSVGKIKNPQDHKIDPNKDLQQQLEDLLSWYQIYNSDY